MSQALGVTDPYPSLRRSAVRLFGAAAHAVERALRRRFRARRRISIPPVSAVWLRRHEIRSCRGL